MLVCAISAGVHAALAPEHFSHSVATGVGFAAAAAALALLALLLARDPTSRPGLVAAALVLAGLLVAYVFAITTGVPVLQPEPEPVELVAVLTKVVELVGLVAAVALLTSPGAGRAGAQRVPLTVLAFVALFSAFVALELSGEHGHGRHGEHSAAGEAAGLEPGGLNGGFGYGRTVTRSGLVEIAPRESRTRTENG